MRPPQFIAIPALLGLELARRVVRGFRAGVLYRWRYKGAAPGGFADFSIADLRPADEAIAQHFYSGEVDLAGVCVSTGGESPFLLQGHGAEWTDALHRFRWLRHMAVVATELSNAHARALVADWIEIWGEKFDTRSWLPSTVAERLISWLTHADLITGGSTEEHRARVMRSVAVQMRFLQRNLIVARDGKSRLLATIALAYGSLCLTGREKSVRPAARSLDRELTRQILPDGGHVSRNPVVLLELLADLLPLRELYLRRGVPLPAQLQPTIDRMFAAVRFFSHANGDLAQFNGTGKTPRELKKNILELADSTSKAAKSAPFSGYERLASGNSVVLIDVGKPESRMTARKAMAGTLSFELSSRRTRFIANCGVPEFDYIRYAPYFRTTAAHSTATIGHSSSSRFAGRGRLRDMLPSPLLHAPENVRCTRGEQDGYEHVFASHDGYEPRFGTLHERELFLSGDGTELNGIDRFVRKVAGRTHDIHIRFHLPPDISSSHLSSGHSILLAGPHGDAWTLTCIDAPMRLEESLYFSGTEMPRKTQQIVIATTSLDHGEIRWSFTYRPAQRHVRSRKQQADTDKTPDLLDTLV